MRTPLDALIDRFTNYRSRYGYRRRWAIAAELAWRLEHLPLSYDGQILAPIARAGYRARKAAERRGKRPPWGIQLNIGALRVDLFGGWPWPWLIRRDEGVKIALLGVLLEIGRKP